MDRDVGDEIWMIWGGRDVSPLTIEEATLRSRTRGRNIKPLVIITKIDHQSCFVLDVSTVLVSEMLRLHQGWEDLDASQH